MELVSRQVEASPANTFLIVGLGGCAQTHIEVIEHMGSRAVIAGGVDIHRTKRLVYNGQELDVDYNVAEAVSAHPAINTVVVSTDTSAHYDVAEQVFAAFDDRWPIHAALVDDQPVHVLVEKPFATTYAGVEELFGRIPNGVRLDALLHCAYTPEVLWAQNRLTDWMMLHGPIVDYWAHFADPRSKPEDAAHRKALVSSWLDTGINALSAAQRLIDITDLELLKQANGLDYQASVIFWSRDELGTGTITTEWSTEEAAYESTFRFLDGAELILNHLNVQGQLNYRDRPVALFNEGEVSRRLSHYLNVYDDLFNVRYRAYADETILNLHELLLDHPILT